VLHRESSFNLLMRTIAEFCSQLCVKGNFSDSRRKGVEIEVGNDPAGVVLDKLRGSSSVCKTHGWETALCSFKNHQRKRLFTRGKNKDVGQRKEVSRVVDLSRKMDVLRDSQVLEVNPQRREGFRFESPYPNQPNGRKVFPVPQSRQQLPYKIEPLCRAADPAGGKYDIVWPDSHSGSLPNPLTKVRGRTSLGRDC